MAYQPCHGHGSVVRNFRGKGLAGSAFPAKLCGSKVQTPPPGYIQAHTLTWCRGPVALWVWRSSLQSHPGLDSFLWWFDSTLVRALLLFLRFNYPSPSPKRNFSWLVCHFASLAFLKIWAFLLILLSDYSNLAFMLKKYKSDCRIYFLYMLKKTYWCINVKNY